eukprot:TRINITY_DN4055_c0_g1_i3.p1 TRINITY_DN4055_c0_g1~~TRINITY_DN4055_c0_g1_i3.p1  ORF type:complete len:467 (+),score=74.50 TRINITY_DN4055_c0_g1_i3:37-1437(+)
MLDLKRMSQANVGRGPSAEAARAEKSSFIRAGPRVPSSRLPVAFTEALQAIPGKEKQLSRDLKSHRVAPKIANPLLPMRRYLRGVEVLDASHQVACETRRPQLSEMITIAPISSGRLKKVLHAPTLRVFALKEILLTDHINAIKNALVQWQRISSESIQLTKVNEIYWNTPEQHVSLLAEFMNAGNLEDIIETVGAVPEQALKQIGRSMAESMKEVSERIRIPIGKISPEYVLFDKSGKLKLSPEVVLSGFRKSEGSGGIKLLGELLLQVFQPSSGSPTLRGDLFQLGLVLLECAVGNFDPFDLSGETALCDAIGAFAQDSLSSSQQPCCILHSTIALRRLQARLARGGQRRLSETIGTLVEAVEFVNEILARRFSDEFISLLCILTSLSTCSYFENWESVLGHSFFRRQARPGRGPELSLAELLRTGSKKKCRTLEVADGRAGQELKRVCEQLTVVLPTLSLIHI